MQPADMQKQATLEIPTTKLAKNLKQVAQSGLCINSSKLSRNDSDRSRTLRLSVFLMQLPRKGNGNTMCNRKVAQYINNHSPLMQGLNVLPTLVG